MKVEAEGKELVLKSKDGDIAIIPVDKSEKARKFIEIGDQDSLNSMIKSLPTEQSMAKEGTLIEGDPEPQTYYTKKSYNKAIKGLVGKQKSYNERFSQYQEEMLDYKQQAEDYVSASDQYNRELDVYNRSKMSYDEAFGGKPEVSYDKYGLDADANLIKPPKTNSIYKHEGAYVSDSKGNNIVYDDVFGEEFFNESDLKPDRLVGTHQGRYQAIYNKPELPQEPSDPIYPVKDFTTDINYDKTYEGLRMSPAWATNIKDNPEANIGTLNPLDTEFKKGFTLEQAKEFPEEVRKAYGIDVPGMKEEAIKIAKPSKDVIEEKAKSMRDLVKSYENVADEEKPEVLANIAKEVKLSSPASFHKFITETVLEANPEIAESVVAQYEIDNPFSRVNIQKDKDETQYNIEGKVDSFEKYGSADKPLYNRVWDFKDDAGKVVVDPISEEEFTAGVKAKEAAEGDYYEHIPESSSLYANDSLWTKEDKRTYMGN